MKDVTILVVDDNEVNLVVAKNMLEFYGAQVDTAENGEAAIALVNGKKYNLVLMDYLMPGINGAETARQIHNLPGENGRTVIIGLSADKAEAAIESFKEAGISQVLTKPLESIILIQSLRKWIPLEKIELGMDQKTEISLARQTSEEASFKDILAKVKDLDFELGLKYSIGSEQSYYRVVKASCKSISNYFVELEIGQQSKDFNRIRIAVHSLKSIFANIGIRSLSEKASFLEEQIRKQEFKLVLGILPDFCRKLAQTHHELEHAVCAYDNINQNVKSICAISYTDLDKKIEQILFHIQRFEIDEIMQGLEEMQMGLIGEQAEMIKQAKDAAGEFNYELVEKLVIDFKKIRIKEEI